MSIKKIYSQFSNISSYLNSLSLLFARLAIAYGFYEPAMRKWSDIDGVASWFGNIGIPMPLLNAYMSATTEILGVILLTIGLFTRLIAIPLIVIMIVAIFAVHLPSGFDSGNNGFEIPLYYGLFLMIFLSHGGGKFSLDYLIFKK